MNWLTIDLIKQQLRLDDSQAAMEGDLLAMYGESAEAALLQLLRRTAENVVETFGGVPKPLIHAALMLVDIAYQYRSPITPASVNQVGYTFEILVKPYMRLAGDDDGGGGVHTGAHIRARLHRPGTCQEIGGRHEQGA